jgi:double-stranded uracil-DNA glycosylase
MCKVWQARAFDNPSREGHHPAISEQSRRGEKSKDGRQGTGQQGRRQEAQGRRQEGRREVASPAGALDRDRYRPTTADLRAAVDRQIDDVISPGLRTLFVGINPGLWSGATGHHFARPGNRFWRAIHAAGLTDEVLSPADQHQLLGYGIGVTNLVYRTTATAAELTADELHAGGQLLRAKLQRYRPAQVAFLGVTTYRVAFDQARALVGRQPDLIAGIETWVLPNPSGLNAHYQLDALARAYAQLRD